MKEFKTTSEQIELLKQRGLIIPDEERAKKYLLSQNYYNLINGYARFFPREGDNYTAQTSFDEITSLYVFEREFKQVLLLGILEAETHLRSIFAHRFAEKFKDEPYAYLNINCYEQDKTLLVAKTISNLSRKFLAHNKDKSNKNSSIAHYLRKYKHVPIWVLVNHIEFGELRHLLKHSKKSLQNKICKDCLEFIGQNIPDNHSQFQPETLNSFLENINDIRNICAHNNRLLGFRCHQSTKYWAPLHEKYNIQNEDERRSAYEAFLTLQCFISRNEYAIMHNTFKKRFKTLSNKLKTIPVNNVLKELGFPDNWHIDNDKIEQL